MKYVVLPLDEERRLSFYLAMEEYVARHVLPTAGSDELFFMWQVQPSVIFGRNQVLEDEVNVDYCREHNILLYRRKSGGGCVYADRSNVMMSYITKGEDVGFAFNSFMGKMLLVLRHLGVEAVGNSHNDIMIGGNQRAGGQGSEMRKVSGTACYHLPGCSIVHATMLYDTDMDNMLGALTPSTEKLQKNGVQSVRQRITLLKDHITQNIEEFKQTVRTTLCSGELLLSETDVSAVKQIEETYLREEFIHLVT